MSSRNVHLFRVDKKHDAVSSWTQWTLKWEESVKYMFEREKHDNNIGSWLHHSLLKKLPDNHDYTRFKDNHAHPADHVVSTLLSLGVLETNQALLMKSLLVRSAERFSR